MGTKWYTFVVFALHFPNGWWCWASFYMLISHLNVYLNTWLILKVGLFVGLRYFCNSYCMYGMLEGSQDYLDLTCSWFWLHYLALWPQARLFHFSEPQLYYLWKKGSYLYPRAFLRNKWGIKASSADWGTQQTLKNVLGLFFTPPSLWTCFLSRRFRLISAWQQIGLTSKRQASKLKRSVSLLWGSHCPNTTMPLLWGKGGHGQLISAWDHLSKYKLSHFSEK